MRKTARALSWGALLLIALAGWISIAAVLTVVLVCVCRAGRTEDGLLKDPHYVPEWPAAEPDAEAEVSELAARRASGARP